MLTNRGKASDIGNRIVFSGNEWTSGEALVENVNLPLRLHCESVDRVLQLDRPLVIEMRKTTPRYAALPTPEKPRQAFHVPYTIKGNGAAELFRQVK
jgi:hypothetical protein